MTSNLKCTLLDSVVELKKLADKHLVFPSSSLVIRNSSDPPLTPAIEI
jgi:hypothetical protein